MFSITSIFRKSNLPYINMAINIMLVGAVLYLCVTRNKKRSIVEGFDNNTIDFEALDNLAKIADTLNKGEAFEFPGDLTVKGELKTDGKLTSNADIQLNKSKLIFKDVVADLEDDGRLPKPPENQSYVGLQTAAFNHHGGEGWSKKFPLVGFRGSKDHGHAWRIYGDGYTGAI